MAVESGGVAAEKSQVVILAGGLGTRLRAIAGDRPKIMMPILGRPFIEWQLALLREAGMREMLLCVGHAAGMVEAHVGDGDQFGVRVCYSREDPAALMGTGGALVHALPLLAERFLVLYGDSYLPIDYQDFARTFLGCGLPAMMSVYRNDGRWDASNVRVEHGRVVLYDKHAPAGTADCIDYGLLGLTRGSIERHRHDAMPLDLSVILGGLVRQGGVAAWMAPRRFYEIGRPEGLADLERHLGGEPQP